MTGAIILTLTQLVAIGLPILLGAYLLRSIDKKNTSAQSKANLKIISIAACILLALALYLAGFILIFVLAS